MVLVALARLDITPPPAWASAMITHVNTGLKGVSPQALTNCMWALATMGFQVNAEGLAAVERQLEAALRASDSSSSGWGSQELSNTLWVLAKWRHTPSEAVMQLLLGRMRQVCLQDAARGGAGRVAGGDGGASGTEVRPQELSNTLWALSQLGVQPSHGWLADMWSACARQINGFSPQDIAQLVYALARLGRRPPPPQYQAVAAAGGWASGNLLGPDESLQVPIPAAPAAAAAAAMPATAAAAIGAAGPSNARRRRTTTAATTAVVTDVAQPMPLQLQPASIAHMNVVSHVGDEVSRSGVTRASGPAPSGPGAPNPDTPTLAPRPVPIPAPAPAPATPPSRPAPRPIPVPAPTMSAATAPVTATSAPSSGHILRPAPAAVPAPAPGPADWLSVLLPRAATTFGRSSGQDLANLTWGLAQLGVQPGQAWCERLGKELQTRGATFSGGHLATCVWAMGRMGYRPAAQSLLVLEGALFKRMPSLKPRELAACCWGFASMSYRPDQEWLEAYAAQCRVLAHEFTQQEWSVVLWSLAGIVDLDKEAGVYLEDLFLSPQLAARLEQFGPSGVAMLTYACGVLGTRSPRLMGRLVAAATRHMPEFTGQELAALVTTCANTGVVPDRAFFAAWVGEVALRMQADDRPGAPLPGTGADGVAARPRAQGFGTAAAVFPAAAAAATTAPAAATAAPAAAAVLDHLPSTPVPLATPADVANMAAPAVGEEKVTDEAQQACRSGGSARGALLTPSMLAVSGWALAKLGLRPKADWLRLYCGTLLRHGRAGTLGPRETHMTVLALAAWERQVPYELVSALRVLTKQHKPTYTKAERWSINRALKTLRTLSTAPPHLMTSAANMKEVEEGVAVKEVEEGVAA